MKHFTQCIALFLILPMLFCTGCSSKTSAIENSAPAATETPAPQRTEEITVSQKVLNLLDMDMPAAARKLGLNNVTENEDGSCTVYMTNEEKTVILEQLERTLEEEIDALPASGLWPFLDRIAVSEDLKTVTLYTTEDRYVAERDCNIASAVYLPCLLYKAFSGENADRFTQEFVVRNEERKEMDSFRYPVPKPTPSPIPEE